MSFCLFGGRRAQKLIFGDWEGGAKEGQQQLCRRNMDRFSRWKRDGAIWIDVRWFESCCEYSFFAFDCYTGIAQRSTPAKPECGSKLQMGIASIIIMILVFERQWQWKCGSSSHGLINAVKVRQVCATCTRASGQTRMPDNETSCAVEAFG